MELRLMILFIYFYIPIYQEDAIYLLLMTLQATSIINLFHWNLEK